MKLTHLSSLREEIVALGAVKCHMSHERIIKAADSMLPVRCHFPEDSYQRVGLCSQKTRAQRLGCSHTMARIKLESAIDELETGEKSGPGSFLRSELNWLNNEIHLLDHRKGEAETTLARILEEYSAGDGASTAERLREAKARWCVYGRAASRGKGKGPRDGAIARRVRGPYRYPERHGCD